MTKEDYVSLDVAKKLKEKGFNECCGAYYHLNWDDMTEEECFEIASEQNFKNSNNVYRVGAPTLHDAQKWLRTSKKIHVNADYEVYREKWFFSLCLINPDKFNQFEDMSESNYNSYEEALNAGILEALNYI